MTRMDSRRLARLVPWVLSPCLTAACADDGPAPAPAVCRASLAPGSPEGHADPFGAKAAGQARAGRIADASTVAQPAHGRQRIQDGDFVLVNDRLAVVIEDVGWSDGYSTFGGEILAIDQVGDDGRPLGLSHHVESLFGIGGMVLEPDSVTVLQDGSDGGAAVVRALGTFSVVPIVEGPLEALLTTEYELDGAYDYVLEPGSNVLTLRLSVINTASEPVDLGVERSTSDLLFGLFHYNHNQAVSPEHGFAEPDAVHDWIGYVSGPWGFAVRSPTGPLEFAFEDAGVFLFFAPGMAVDPCSITTVDHAEFVAGGPHYDGLRAALRDADGEPPWREVSGTATDSTGAPVPGALIHELALDETYLSRTVADADGRFTLHVPPGEPVRLVAQRQGYPAHAGVEVAPGTGAVELAFEPHATLEVTATDLAGSGPLPARVQVIPSEAPPSWPAAYGVLPERNGRLHQHFAETGEATLVVPPGEHRVIVSRGYEFEIVDQLVTVAAGETAVIDAVLEHSVDSSGVMCADFHIHSHMSQDSNDPIDYKVRGAVADGLEIPVSSEHEWVVDFGPVVERLGLSAWAFGMPSSELSTWQFGHFGVIPLQPRPDALNNGAINWVGKTPAEIFAEVHGLPESPALVVNHPRGGFGGYFSAMNLDRQTGIGRSELWSDDFDAIEVFNDSDFEDNRSDSVADWFALLDLGFDVAAVGSSDSHHLRSSPAGYARTCLRFGHDDPRQLTAGEVRDAMVAGRSIVSGGLMMTVAGPAGEGPGATIAGATDSVELTVTVEGPSWIAGETLETIVNGETLHTEPLLPLGSGTSNRYVNVVTVPIDPTKPRTWVVFHAKGEGDLAPLHPGRRPFAVSNPIFLE